MPVTPRKFFKPKAKDDDRDRLNFDEIVEHCPDLGNRVIVIRSRVKDLRQKFQADCKWALKGFNTVTTATIAIAIFGIFVGVVIALVKPDAGLAATVSVAFGAIVGIAGAGSKAFGWHKRYHAMFRARWAMASLEVYIDDLIYDLAVGVQKGAELSVADRETLRKAANSWLEQIDTTLKTFGDSYPTAISPVEIRSKK
ncbi:hypothetical protein [Phaeobacter sp. 22II1-1F12B]|uniref:hypothetical protein n=1 Tax=Phaeobacter sp. 22II1-1F12B TaxID=1317111 RepID=UPI000B526FC5|nr:hypothetical protein [Phaeobacter sp. 22II1-1F12B]OWU70461.1 hypothetical protein ATO1_23980 [Phaeobacter sp. 22II1-1F12B]